MKGWKIVMAMAIALGITYEIVWGGIGITEETTRFLIRFTARSSCLAFLAAFVAAPLHQLWKSSISQWLVQNRRFLGISMAVSHGYHAIAVSTLQLAIQNKPLQGDPLAILGYVFLIAMTITSFSGSAKAIGRRAWRILHTAGMHYFWLAFALEFGMRMNREWGYLLLTALVAIVMIIRLIARSRLKPAIARPE